MQINQTKTIKTHVQNDWVFVPTFLSGFAGVAIGVAIGNMIGWI